jgi:hypothetical protein
VVRNPEDSAPKILVPFVASIYCFTLRLQGDTMGLSAADVAQREAADYGPFVDCDKGVGGGCGIAEDTKYDIEGRDVDVWME